MSKYDYAGTITGQAFRVKAVQTIATATPMPIVAEADLKNKNHPINIEHLSGKQKGAMVVVDKKIINFILLLHVVLHQLTRGM